VGNSSEFKQILFLHFVKTLCQGRQGVFYVQISSCSGCAVTREDEPIKVTIKWDGKNEETFYLK
jgi:hypothetical protein